MTDYIYSLSLATQTKGFLLSMGFGFIMGILYDFVRIIRLAVNRGKALQIASDILYFILLGFLTFLFCLIINEGEIRLYILVGEAMGFGIYYFSLGAVIFSVSEKIIGLIKKTAKTVFGVLIFPFCFCYKKIRDILVPCVKKLGKSRKNIENKSKFLLKVNTRLLYNLNVKKKSPAKSGQMTERKVR